MPTALRQTLFFRRTSGFHFINPGTLPGGDCMRAATSPASSPRALRPQPQGLVGALPATPGPLRVLSPSGQSFRAQSSLPRTPCSGKVLHCTRVPLFQVLTTGQTSQFAVWHFDLCLFPRLKCKLHEDRVTSLCSSLPPQATHGAGPRAGTQPHTRISEGHGEEAGTETLVAAEAGS